MPRFVYRIQLKKHHQKKGLSIYKVAAALGISKNTVQRYSFADVVEVTQINASLAALCDFYGVDFHDVVTVRKIEEGRNDDEKEG